MQTDEWHAQSAERTILGALLIGAPGASEAVASLDPAVFFHARDRLLFQTIRRLESHGTEADLVTVAETLRAEGQLEEAGGEPYLAELQESALYAESIDQYVRILEAAAERRKEGRRVVALSQELESGILRLQSGEDPIATTGLLQESLEAFRNGNASSPATPPTAREIIEDPQARRVAAVVADLLAWRQHTTLFAGREKDGKSTLVRYAVARRSEGKHVWGGPDPGDGPMTVLYWGQERPVDIASDLYRMGADMDRVHIRDMRLHPGDRPTTFARDVEAVSPDLAVIDTLSTYTDGMELDPGRSADWEPVMNTFGALAQRADLGLLIIHHARKSDGSYRDSTSIGASVDCILEMRRDKDEGENVRAVTARARSAVPARSFKYAMTQMGSVPHLDLLDDSQSVHERVMGFIQRNQGCSQRDILDAVRGRREDVRTALHELCEDGGPVVVDDSGTPFRYSIPG